MRKPISIAIIGGGFTGLSAAFYLSKLYKITIYESKPIFGGLASGFKRPLWDWFLEYAYHHIFTSDKDIIEFVKKTKYNKLIKFKPETASLFKYNNKQYIHPVDNIFDYLSLPNLSFASKLRSGVVLGWLKKGPFLAQYNKITAEDFIKKTMGNDTWVELWQQLFRKKFGKYAGKIRAAFFWGRIQARTRELYYPTGGFQEFINYVCDKIKKQGGLLLNSNPVHFIEKDKQGFTVFSQEGFEKYTHIIVTTPSPIFLKIGERILPEIYMKQLKKLRYLSALSLISISAHKLLTKTYWLNIGASDLPLMGIIQHTNMVSPSFYNNKEIVYIPYYLEDNDSKLYMSEREIGDFVNPYLQKINPCFNILNTRLFLFKERYAQPIYDNEFIKNIPTIKTPIKNLFIANLDMTYPYDRGTNYAVKLGKEVVQMVLSEKNR